MIKRKQSRNMRQVDGSRVITSVGGTFLIFLLVSLFVLQLSDDRTWLHRQNVLKTTSNDLESKSENDANDDKFSIKSNVQSSAFRLRQDTWYTDMLRGISSKCKHMSHFFHHFLPHEECNNMVRIGKCKDGSKLVCMDEFQGRNTKRADNNNKKCVVYSFGSSDDSCFESEMAIQTDCEIHIFDPTSQELKDERWTYHSYGLTGHDPAYTTFWNWRTQKRANCTDCPMKNLRDIMTELGHDWIDILKVDIDGAEWRSFQYVYDVMKTVPATQMQIELTGLDITDQPDSLANKTEGVYKLWENFINDGFKVFFLEPNLGTCRREKDRSASFEYALIRHENNS